MTTPSTIPGWETLGYHFDDAGDSSRFGFWVASPEGADLGVAAGDTPEAAAAAACEIAQQHAGRAQATPEQASRRVTTSPVRTADQ